MEIKADPGCDDAQDFTCDIEPGTLNAALPAIYQELRAMASGYLRQERPGHTLQPTALVHESYLRLAGQHGVDWNNRLQFLSIAARMMRRILCTHARDRSRLKRNNGEVPLELDLALELYDTRAVDVTAVDEALRDLEKLDARQARVVELRFFGGLSMPEVGEVLDLSLTTVNREWAIAKRWLKRELAGSK